MNRSRFLSTLWAAGACTLFGARAQAQPVAFPGKPIRMLVPFAPGQGSDTLARALGERLSSVWGQPVVVENKSGANGALAVQELARSAPDGHTLLLSSNSPIVINPNLYKHLAYNVERDLKPVALLGATDLVLLVTPSLPVKTVAEFIAHLKAHPGQLSYGSPGIGSTSHLCMEMFMQATGTSLAHVPYKGSSPAITDLIGGNIQVMIDALPSALPHARGGRLRMLALTGSKPSSFAPELPTLAASGVAGLASGGWYGVFAPAAIEPTLLARLHDDLVAAMARPEVLARLQILSMEPVSPLSTAGFAEMIERETQAWARTTRALSLYQSQ